MIVKAPSDKAVSDKPSTKSCPPTAGPRLTCGQQVQSRFQTAPTPVFGSSQRPPLNGEGCVVRQEGYQAGDTGII